MSKALPRKIVPQLLSLLVVSTCLAVNAPRSAQGITATPGRQVDDFRLQDYRGRWHSLDEYRDQPIVVLAFLGTECPLAKLYGPRLRELAGKYEPRGVVFLGVNANQQDSITEIASYARRHRLEFPILKDVGNKVADRLDARRTPEVFVLDAQREVRYRGAIDDQYGVGYSREKPERHFLADALRELLEGKDVTVPLVEAVGCHIGRVREPRPDSKVTYSNQVARILQRHCVECHRPGQIAPFSLTDYDEVVGWSEMIVEVVQQQRMPPWHADPEIGEFANAKLLTDEEKQLLYQWAAEGAPQGDPQDLPELPTYPEGWMLPVKPDLVLPMAEEPFVVPAEGTVEYQYFEVDPGFTEDKWIRGAEIQFGSPSVVHHLVLLLADAGRTTGKDRGEFLFGRSPGNPPKLFPPGYAKRIPADSRLVFEVHYTPIGTPQEDLSKVGLVFADPSEVQYEITTLRSLPRNFLQDFVIPPQAENHEIQAAWKLRRDVHLISMTPHMHLRGKSMRYEARYPDGTMEPLLSVPNYDFNWQLEYDLEEPKFLPEGTTVHVVSHYDNSARNLSNPDPSATVRWGDQSADEMLIAYFDVYAPKRTWLGYRWIELKREIRRHQFLAGALLLAVTLGGLGLLLLRGRARKSVPAAEHTAI